VDEVVELVKGHSRVRAVGLGHSYNRFTCSPDLMIATTQLDGVLELDTKHLTVTTQAGIRTRRLMDWLADHGYALPIAPFYIDQTIGGAVSTASHGSSLTIGSLSSLVKAMKVVLADGTVKTITEKDGDLMQAARTSVGFLGVIVELTLAVVKDDVVQRETTYIHDDDLLCDLKLAAVHALPYDTVQYWYAAPIRTAVKSRIRPPHGHHRQSQPDTGRSVSEFYLRTIKGSPYERLFLRLQAHFMKNDSSTAATYNLFWHTIYSSFPGNYKLSAAWPVQQEAETDVLQQVYGHYDQYEWAVALDKAHGCFSALFDMMDRNVTNRVS
jgi:FAD/FMN-containing dehydrogenase